MVVLSMMDIRRGVRPPRWYVRAGVPRDRLGRFYEFYPAPIAWAIRARHWLWGRTGLTLLIWMYDLAILDWPEAEDVRSIRKLLRTFTLNGPAIYKRQVERHHLDRVEQRGYEKGYHAGMEFVWNKMGEAGRSSILTNIRSSEKIEQLF